MRLSLLAYLFSLVGSSSALFSQSLNWSADSLRAYIYDDQHIYKHLDGRFHYLKRVDEHNRTIGYVGPRDYFDLSKVFWPDAEYEADKNIEQYLYEELRAMDIKTGTFFTDDIWQYSSARELAESGGPEANEMNCQQDLSFLSLELAKGEEYLYEPGRARAQLLRWIDAWGRPPIETQWGNSFWKGSFRACKLVEVPKNNGEPEIRFNYCWAKLKAKDWPSEDVLIPKVTLRVGTCLPRSCDTSMARRQKDLVIQMMEFNFSPLQRSRFLNKSLEDIYCLPLNRPSLLEGSGGSNSWPPELNYFMTLVGVWLVHIAAASCIYPFTDDEHLLACLSIQKNWSQLISEEYSGKSRVDLRAVSVIKLVSCLLVTFAHSFQFIYWYFHASTMHLIESRRIHYLLMVWFLKSVDVFFITSGILSAYALLRKFPKDKLKLIIKPRVYLFLNLARYLRLAPVLMFVLAFTKAAYVHLSDGPFWDYATYELSHEGRCKHSSWWRQLIWPIVFDFAGSGGDPYSSECMPSSWYIITDMKMFLVVPPFFYLLYKSEKWRLPLVALALIVSTLWNYAQMNLQQLIYFRQYLQYGMMHATSITITHYESSYFSPINRFYSVALGLFAGIHLHSYKQGLIIRWPRYMRSRVLWLAIVAWQIYDLFFHSTLTEINFRRTGQVPSEKSMKLMTLFKQRIDSITIVLFTLRLATDWARPLMRNASFCFKLSKLSYCVYLIHTLLIHYTLTATEHSRPDTDPMQLLMFGVFIIAFSFVLALPLYLLVESPLALLLNRALDGGRGAPLTRHRLNDGDKLDYDAEPANDA